MFVLRDVYGVVYGRRYYDDGPDYGSCG